MPNHLLGRTPTGLLWRRERLFRPALAARGTIEITARSNEVTRRRPSYCNAKTIARRAINQKAAVDAA